MNRRSLSEPNRPWSPNGRSATARRSGVILLVVLSSLTFFSILVVTYFVFSSQAQQSAYGMNASTTRAPDVAALIDEALMTLLRGTTDVNSGFYGESMMEDYYGHDGLEMQSNLVSSFAMGPFYLGKGFVRFPVARVRANSALAANDNDRFRAYNVDMDDMLTGRLITFEAGPLRNRTYRVIRSIYRPGNATVTPPILPYDDVYIELDERDWDPSSNVAIQSLFYVDPANLTQNGFRCYLNGIPQNSRGLGFDGTNLNATVGTAGLRQGRGFADLPVSLQPNQMTQLGTIPDKSTTPGDFDEDYDAADMMNWWLGYRHADGEVIPSFHRPAVLNYILNEMDWAGASDQDYADLVASLARATMRPLPIAQQQLAVGSAAVNPRFTGGNSNFALRTPLLMRQANGPVRLHQLANALINDYDVDNDDDGQSDSVWINPGLPLITSREGKLLRPLIAVMIEDMSARLNVNAVGNTQLLSNFGGLLANRNAMWAGSRGPLTSAQNARNSFRGIGYGPAEMMIPAVSFTAGRLTNTNILSDISGLITDRYGADNVPGGDIATPWLFAVDGLDTLRHGHLPATHHGLSGYGHSLDPFGRGGIGIGMSGDLVAANSGGAIRQSPPYVNEAINDPYEMDPSGGLGGDDVFTVGDLEAILKSNSFSSELLPQRLRSRLQDLIASAPEFNRSVTTTSVSGDGPPTLDRATPLLGFVDRLSRLAPGVVSSMNANQLARYVAEIVPPEIRLGRKLDVNRPFGNGVDDDRDGLIDEPSEVGGRGSNGIDDDGDSMVDEADERVGELNASGLAAFPGIVPPASTPQVLGQALPHGFATSPLTVPDYQFDSNTAVDGRQLLARNLYVMMMMLTSDGIDFPSVGPTPFNPADQALYKARRMAQWAINVVDFRDPDAIMTRFAFDPNPFDGWNPGTSAESVVWGVEAPEMLFSESLALHDVRCRDTDQDNGGGDDKMNGDTNSDQVRIPQGSLLMEIMCTHPARTSVGASAVNDEVTQPSFPQEIYTSAGTVDLARTNSQGLPVWRIAFSEPHPAGSAKEDLNPMNLRDDEPDVGAFAPETSQQREIDPALGAGTALDLERFVWFTAFAAPNDISTLITNVGITDMQANEVFFAPAMTGNPTVPNRVLAPGQYLTIAPRLKTHLGSQEAPVGTFPGAPSYQRFESDMAQGLIHYEAGAAIARTTPALGAGVNYTPALPLVVGTFPPAGWAAGIFPDNFVGLNISEPLPRGTSYYPEPTTTYNDTPGMAASTDNDGDGNVDYPLQDAYLNFVDPSTYSALDDPSDTDPNFGILPTTAGGEEPRLGSIAEFRTAYLQRLADPTAAYDSVMNPYRTIDWMTIDLTVFSGEDRESGINGANRNYVTSSRQRNGHLRRFNNAGVPSSSSANSLYSYQTNTPATSVVDSTAPDYFTLVSGDGFIGNSFSFLNTATIPTGPTDTTNGKCNPGFNGFAPSVGSLGAAASSITTTDRNLPTTPFAKHPWLNRPFASHLELMMVPACSQTRLFEEFAFNIGGDPAVYPDSTSPDDSVVFNAPFRHLLNFFHSSVDAADGAQFGRLFDFVHTLPRFRGEVDVITPGQLTSAVANQEAELARMRTLLVPPFNLKYDNLRQGRVNLNTIAEFPVWVGLMHGHLNDNPSIATGTEFTSPGGGGGQLSFNNFLANRRGYPVGISSTPVTPVTSGTAGTYNYDPDRLDPRFPTQFAGVFKNSVHSPLAPRLRDTVDTDKTRRREAHGTLLRGAGTLDTIDTTTTQLFVRNAAQAPVSATSIHQNRDRNPFLRYQTLMRMPNLASNNSQVYSMRMTMGFFEVDANDVNSVGREYKADTGQNKRYRAMFIIDRSRPVGFKPGENLNVRDTVIFESYDQ